MKTSRNSETHYSRHLNFCLPLIAFAAMLLASCGESYDAKNQIKKFMKESMNTEDVDYISWSDVDSTFRVKDSVLQVMHHTAEKNRIVKPDTKYQPRTSKLNIVTVRYAVDKDTLMNTFYLDDKLQGVVGVKSDNIIKIKPNH